MTIANNNFVQSSAIFQLHFHCFVKRGHNKKLTTKINLPLSATPSTTPNALQIFEKAKHMRSR